jgi:hypothetical protein
MPNFKSNSEAIASLDQLDAKHPGKITITLSASEASNIGALLERNVRDLTPDAVRGNELAARLATDSSNLNSRLRALAEEQWG